MLYQINLALELPENPLSWQVKDLEKAILDQGRQAMRQIFASVLLDFEKSLLKSQTHWDRKEKWKKKIATCFGEMALKRYRVWDRQEKKSRYPLDEALGIEKWKKGTDAFQKVLTTQAVQRPYRQAEREIRAQTGVEKSVMATWATLQQQAQNQKKVRPPPQPWKDLLLPDPPLPSQPDPCPALGIDLDGTWCRSWKTKKDWEKDHAVKVAVLYRHKIRVGKNRWLLKDKQIVMSGPGEGLAHFLNRVTERAVTHYGLHQKTQVVIHGDGDTWIRHYALHHFPRAIYRLDPWHVKKKIREATGYTQIPPPWETLIYGDPEALILQLHLFKVKRTPPRSEQRRKMEELIGYLKNNREGLLPSGVSQATKRKYPRLFKRGSGTIERNIAWTINDRFKLPRMSWSQKGLENLAFLREDYLNQYQQPVFQPIPGLIKLPLSLKR